MIILSHSGKQHSYQVAKALYNLGFLKKFITSSYLRSDYLQKRVKKSGNQYFSRRFIEGLPGENVIANWRYELPEIILRQLTGKSPKTQRAVYQRDINFDHYVAKNLQSWLQTQNPKTETLPSRLPSPVSQLETPNSKLLTSFWGFQGSCHTTLQRANELGINSIVELATAHVTGAQKILGEEQKLLPQWADSIDNLVFPIHYEKRLKEEPHIAKYVISASDFTTQTLLDDNIPKEKIIKLPLGFDLNYISPKPTITTNPTTNHLPPISHEQLSTRNQQPETSNPKPATRNFPFKLLYCGTVTQRKGIYYLLEAIKSFKKSDIELHIIGGVQGSGEALKKYKEHYIYHPPVSQHEMFNLYKEYDALILPSIFEGFGLVIVEAMAAGLPVIATPNTMGPDVIEDGKNGCLIPIRDIDAIKTAIEKILNLSENEYHKMSSYARESVLKFTWAEYQKRLNVVIEDILKN